MKKYKTTKMKSKKSYWMKSKGGNVASTTFEGSKKPSKKTIKIISLLIDLAYKKK